MLEGRGTRFGAAVLACACGLVAILFFICSSWNPAAPGRRLSAGDDFRTRFKPSTGLPAAGQNELLRVCHSMRPRALSAPRRVYIDLGANWANTLRLWQHVGCVGNGEGAPGEASVPPWEVYAFELWPSMLKFNADVVDWLNGKRIDKPVMPVPEGGSSLQTWKLFHRRTGCTCVPQRPKTARIRCMQRNASQQVQKFMASFDTDAKRIATPHVIQAALAEAREPPPRGSSRPRYTFIPAGGSNQAGVFDKQVHVVGLIRNRTEKVPLVSMQMHIVDVVEWIKQSFSPEDWVVLKMDIEGAEFSVLPSLIRTGGIRNVDLVAWECHGPIARARGPMGDTAAGNNCIMLTRQLKQAGVEVLVEYKNYIGYDDNFIDEFGDGPAPTRDELARECGSHVLLKQQQGVPRSVRPRSLPFQSLRTSRHSRPWGS